MTKYEEDFLYLCNHSIRNMQEMSIIQKNAVLNKENHFYRDKSQVILFWPSHWLVLQNSFICKDFIIACIDAKI